MEPEGQIIFHFLLDNDPEEISIARYLLRPIFLQFLSSVETNRCLLATEEALVNVFEHGYKNTEGQVDLYLVKKEDHLLLVLDDRAPLFDPMAKEMEAPDHRIETGKDGGFGLFFIRSIMDVKHQALPGGGNRLMMRIDI